MKKVVMDEWPMAQLRAQQAEAAKLDAAIVRKLEELGYGDS